MRAFYPFLDFGLALATAIPQALFQNFQFDGDVDDTCLRIAASGFFDNGAGNVDDDSPALFQVIVDLWGDSVRQVVGALLSPSIRMSFPAPLGPTINSSFPFALIIHFYTFNLGHLRFFSPFPNFNTKRLAPNRNSGSGGCQGGAGGWTSRKTRGPRVTLT